MCISRSGSCRLHIRRGVRALTCRSYLLSVFLYIGRSPYELMWRRVAHTNIGCPIQSRTVRLSGLRCCGRRTHSSRSTVTDVSRSRTITLIRVPSRLKRYCNARHQHFITCSCHRRRPILGTARRCDLFLKILEQTRRRYQFVVVGYVVMPEHFHLLISEPEKGDP
jgi:Transposase IS200 like